ncbi:MAG: hypothetical protein WC610_00665 [Patescibacteria group bacterium]
MKHSSNPVADSLVITLVIKMLIGHHSFDDDYWPDLINARIQTFRHLTKDDTKITKDDLYSWTALSFMSDKCKAKFYQLGNVARQVLQKEKQTVENLRLLYLLDIEDAIIKFLSELDYLLDDKLEAILRPFEEKVKKIK